MSRKNRVPRAILGFVGKWSRSIFGTATLKDVKTLERHMVAMNQENIALSHAFQEHADTLTSFMSSTDDRFQMAMDGISVNHNLLEALAVEFAHSKTSWEYTFTAVLTALVKEVLLHAQVGHGLISLEEAVHQLIRHELPPFLVPVSMLNDTMNRIETKLKARFNGQYKLATREPESRVTV